MRLVFVLVMLVAVPAGAHQVQAGEDAPAVAQPSLAQPSLAQPPRTADDGEARGRAVLGRIALGFVLGIAGATAIVIALIYHGANGLTLVSFGLFSLAYGARILIAVPAIAQLVGASRRTLFFTAAALTYLLPALGLWYAEQVRGRGWMSLLRRTWQAGFALSVAFIAYDRVAGPFASVPVYRVFLLVAMVVLLVHVVWWRHQDRVERSVRMFGTAVLALAVIHDNLAAFLPWRASLEVYGISVFILSLGYVTARSFFADQRELAAVERELETARSIQTAILPRELPPVKNVSMAVRFVPARSVAGDIYDFLRLDDERVGVLVADVAGHGVSAALIGSMAKVAFSSQKAHTDDPGRTLAEINRVLCGHFDARYVTAAYVFFDSQRRFLRYSLAGHPPPLLWKGRSRQLMPLTEGSTVLGVFPDAKYPAAETAFEPGDRLVLYTDGLVEVANGHGEWFGDRELSSFIAANSALEPAAFVDALVRALSSWSGRRDNGQFADDLTVVVVDLIR